MHTAFMCCIQNEFWHSINLIMSFPGPKPNVLSLHDNVTHSGKICSTFNEICKWFHSALCCCDYQSSVCILMGHIMQCRYNSVNFLPNPYKIHPVAHPVGQDMGCILWVQTQICALPQSLQWCIPYHAIFNHVITAHDCISLHSLGLHDWYSQLNNILEFLVAQGTSSSPKFLLPPLKHKLPSWQIQPQEQFDNSQVAWAFEAIWGSWVIYWWPGLWEFGDDKPW